MANYARGAGSRLQVGKETTYGQAATPTVQMNFLSESLTQEIIRETEDSLVLAKTKRSMDVMSHNSSGDFNVILKPENLKQLLHLAMGVESSPAAKDGTDFTYEHQFTLIGAEGSLPSFTAVIDRKVAVPAYTGLKVSTLSMEASSGDYIRMTASLQGSGKEEAGSLENLDAPVLKAFRFVNGSLTIDGTEFAQVTAVNLNIDNQLDEGEQTLGSGYYRDEGEHNEREVSVSIDCFYNAAANTIREEKYKADGATAAISMTFETPEEIEPGEKYRFTVELPNVVITDASPNVAGREKIDLTIEGEALETDLEEAITVTVYDDDDNTAF
ncbi:phage tail tube protein [Spirochaeta africana]|uniref:Uncharacterized protein n=1 Tax=Spirochaeta africana (strain ATCC 700263 / DSM 8902 / Z-7692) TaxID=889378 RepID=H9UJD7_SPIAZ|nr:phage tail tube protein [Spirochaeta africana]AFG37630.1 hypothetical protein Spiaf_1571 [Spirochaeta africana DSM 8902]